MSAEGAKRSEQAEISITLVLPFSVVESIGNALAKEPFNKVAGILQLIGSQVEVQINELEAKFKVKPAVVSSKSSK